MVFGEPDIALDFADGRTCWIELNGHGYLRSDHRRSALSRGTAEDVACWFIDTDYDEESFFVRQAYFLGARPLREASSGR